MMDKKFALIVVCSLLFAGCQHDQERRIEEERRAAQEAKDYSTANKECIDALDAVNNKRQVDYQKCLQPKFRILHLKYYGGRNVDIYDHRQKIFMLIATKIDAGKITLEEADVEFSEADLWFNNEGRSRALIEYNMRMEELRALDDDLAETFNRFRRKR